MPPVGRTRIRPRTMKATLPFVNFHTHHPAHEGELSLGGEEHGFDTRWDKPLDIQEQEFARAVEESEHKQTFLTIHCVKSIDTVLRMRRTLKPSQPWLFHGFRGKPQQLRSLVEAGLFISFGFRYNVQSLLLGPLERMCLETDDNPGPIRPLYEEVSRLRGVTLESLQTSMVANMHKLMQKDPATILL